MKITWNNGTLVNIASVFDCSQNPWQIKKIIEIHSEFLKEIPSNLIFFRTKLLHSYYQI